MKYTKDVTTAKVHVTEDGDVIITAKSGYNSYVDVLFELTNNGNGYYAKSVSYTSVEADAIFNLSYSDIEYIYYAYKALKKKGFV